MIEQNTQEWIELRKRKIGASDAPIIMGESPYKTPYELWCEKLDLKDSSTTAAMRYGHDMEHIIRAKFEKVAGCEVKSQVLFHPRLSWMMASLDGLNEYTKVSAEFKAANEKDHEIAKSNQVPPKYYAQIQHQLELLFNLYGINIHQYVSHHKDDMAIVEVERDPLYIKKMLSKEGSFVESVESFTAPMLTDRDYRTIEDPALLSKAREMAEILPKLDALEKRKKELRADLIKGCSGYNSQVGGIKLSKVVSKGNVDYKSIPEIQSVNLDLYRKPPIEKWFLKAQ